MEACGGILLLFVFGILIIWAKIFSNTGSNNRDYYGTGSYSGGSSYHGTGSYGTITGAYVNLNVRASEIIANRVRASSLYQGKRLTVTGTVTNIEGMYGPGAIGPVAAVVTLDYMLRCQFQSRYSVQNIFIGNDVKISGIYRGSVLTDCEIVSVNTPAQHISHTPKPEPATSSNPVFDAMLRKAESGDSQAQYTLGMAYFEGKIVQRNDAKGLEWLTKSAEQNYVDALYELGTMYANGFLVEQDTEKGAYYLKKAAEQGHQQAKLLLGIMKNPESTSVSEPDEEYDSIRSIRQKATNGDSEAQYELGMYYFIEKEDNKEAVKWFFKASQQGHSEANEKMKMIFQEYPGVQSWFLNNPDARK